MRMAGPLERDTCDDYVLPRLKATGWSDDQILEQYRITDGRPSWRSTAFRNSRTGTSERSIDPSETTTVCRSRFATATESAGGEKREQHTDRPDSADYRHETARYRGHFGCTRSLSIASLLRGARLEERREPRGRCGLLPGRQHGVGPLGPRQA